MQEKEFKQPGERTFSLFQFSCIFNSFSLSQYFRFILASDTIVNSQRVVSAGPRTIKMNGNFSSFC